MSFFKYIVLFFILFQISACNSDNDISKINIDYNEHSWLKNRKIFIDPGHGGLSGKNTLRRGPRGTHEEEINLEVSLLLADMLEKSGTIVKLSRKKDKDITLDERVKMAEEFAPDILLSIHHDGASDISERENINFPSVLYHGSKENNRLSLRLAEITRDKLNGIMDNKGVVFSDYVNFKETGLKILRETRYLCPGILTESGFFTNSSHELRLMDKGYNKMEAEALYYAISSFFKRGIPRAKIFVSDELKTKDGVEQVLENRNPVIGIETTGGIEEKGIYKNSLKVTINDLPYKTKKTSDTFFIIKGLKNVAPGSYLVRFSFKNKLFQDSEIYKTSFIILPGKGEISLNTKKAIGFIKKGKEVNKALKLLLPAYQMSPYYPGYDRLCYYIAKGFKLIKRPELSEYYYQKIYHFYPESPFLNKIKKSFSKGYRYPVDYYGKSIPLQYRESLKELLPCTK